MTRVYYKEAVGCFIVFDVTRGSTFEAVTKWKTDLDNKVQLPDGNPVPCVLLANKVNSTSSLWRTRDSRFVIFQCDLAKEGLVNNSQQMDEFCQEKGFIQWFETSAKENINIEASAKFLIGEVSSFSLPLEWLSIVFPFVDHETHRTVATTTPEQCRHTYWYVECHRNTCRERIKWKKVLWWWCWCWRQQQEQRQMICLSFAFLSL